ncbi:hypothetical protein M758_3G024300 [Ceratodon purpureus]|nr:hypothetical protein M758_3G024300 [Ceratodon purpureus]
MGSTPGAGGQAVPDTVFADIESELAEYDERECLLANAYREEEQRRRERERVQTQAGGVNLASFPNGLGAGGVDSDEEAAGELSYCYNEIKNLVLIEKSLIHKKALEEWTRKENLFTARVERKTKKVDSLKNEVYSLLGFFSVFQGVLLTAVSQSNLLHCNNLWSPVVLSVLASVVTIAAIAQKLYQISSLLRTISSEEQAVKDVVHRGQELRREGKNFVFAKFSKNKQKEPKKNYFWLYAGLVLSFLVLFTVAFALSHWRILCYPGSTGSPASPPT